ncbi:MAG: DUF2141 domain-containing protein [Flavobacteriaceae bacterium]
MNKSLLRYLGISLEVIAVTRITALSSYSYIYERDLAFGFSNNPRRFMGRPKFDHSKFNFTENPQTLSIRLKH